MKLFLMDNQNDPFLIGTKCKYVNLFYGFLVNFINNKRTGVWYLHFILITGSANQKSIM